MRKRKKAKKVGIEELCANLEQDQTDLEKKTADPLKKGIIVSNRTVYSLVLILKEVACAYQPKGL